MGERGQSPVVVKFWGVRGSIAAPGESTLKFGGNTPCLEIRFGDHTFMLDCGTGSRELGREMMGRAPVRMSLLFSDYRWDHIQGFPFFTPVYIPSSEIHVYGPASGGKGVKAMLAAQMKFPVFPIQLEHLNAKFTWTDLASGDSFKRGDVKVTTLANGSGSLGFRFDDGDRSVVYLPEPSAIATRDAQLVGFCRKASLIVFNTTVAGSLNGHRPAATRETWEAAVSIARASKARRLVTFHHAPEDDDRTLEALERRARKSFAGTQAAYEGLRLAL
jgi:phosphoribosyl 1,2-cyclic phosphodiesterase